MRRERAIAIITTCAIFAASMLLYAGNVPAPDRTKLGKADWSVKASVNLAKNPPDEETVEHFVAAVENAIQHETSMEYGMSVCRARFEDLRHNGTLSLIYGLYTADRPSPC